MASIHTINVGGTQYDIKSTHYATCTTAAGTAAKTATIQNGSFTLDTGVKVSVKFTYANSVASTTLNINSTGAKAIRWKNAALPSSQYWSAGQVVDFLYDGSYWHVIGVITDNNTTYSAATTSAAGLMSASDKTKLDGIATGANKITIDSALSSTSTNPVQNQVVNAAISNLNTLVGDTPIAEQIDTLINSIDNLVYASEENQESSVVPLDADTLGGNLPAYYAGLANTAESNANTYTNTMFKKAAPVNLLDNSDFTNPVNQRSASGYIVSAYGIDRWYFYNTTLSYAEGTCVFNGNMVWQYINQSSWGKNITAVLTLADDNRTQIIATGKMPNDLVSQVTGIAHAVSNNIALDVNLSTDGLLQFIITLNNMEHSILNAALYEGEYTAETLPEYQPKGYAAELAECQRYFQVVTVSYEVCGYGYTESETKARLLIPSPVRMRIDPSYYFKDMTLSDLECISNGQTHNVLSIEQLYMLSRGFVMRVAIASATANHAASLRCGVHGQIQFSADL